LLKPQNLFGSKGDEETTNWKVKCLKKRGGKGPDLKD